MSYGRPRVPSNVRSKWDLQGEANWLALRVYFAAVISLCLIPEVIEVSMEKN